MRNNILGMILFFALIFGVYGLGIATGVSYRTNRYIPLHTTHLTLAYGIGDRVVVTDYSINKPQVKVEGIVCGWGISDFHLTGKEEIYYYVMTSNDHSAHGYSIIEIEPFVKY